MCMHTNVLTYAHTSCYSLIYCGNGEEHQPIGHYGILSELSLATEESK